MFGVPELDTFDSTYITSEAHIVLDLFKKINFSGKVVCCTRKVKKDKSGSRPLNVTLEFRNDVFSLIKLSASLLNITV